MRKVQFFLFISILFIGLTSIGCSKTKTSEEEANSSNGTNIEEEESQESNNQGDIIDPNTFAIKVDHNLTGIDLIRAAKIINPIKAITYDIKTVIGSGEYKYETTGKVIKSGNSYRTDIEVQGDGVEVTIYNSEEKMTYKYNQDRKEGYKYQDDENFGEGPTITDEYDLTMSYIDESNLAKAEVIQYEGEPVMYFEIIEGTNKVCSWISLRYGMTIRTEMYDSNNLVSETVITDITLPASINASNFIPPNDIAFKDYSTTNQDESLEGFEDGQEYENSEGPSELNEPGIINDSESGEGSEDFQDGIQTEEGVEQPEDESLSEENIIIE